MSDLSISQMRYIRKKASTGWAFDDIVKLWNEGAKVNSPITGNVTMSYRQARSYARFIVTNDPEVAYNREQAQIRLRIGARKPVVKFTDTGERVYTPNPRSGERITHSERFAGEAYRLTENPSFENFFERYRV